MHNLKKFTARLPIECCTILKGTPGKKHWFRKGGALIREAYVNPVYAGSVVDKRLSPNWKWTMSIH